MMLPIETMHILFLQQNTLQYLLPYPASLVCVQPKRKGNNRFKIVVCSPTFRRSQIASLGSRREKHSTLENCFNGSSECRGYYPEQLHQFHFRHPNIIVWDVQFAAFSDCLCTSLLRFHRTID